MKKNISNLIFDYNSYANWLKVDVVNAEQRQYEEHPTHRIWCGQDNISEESKLFAARPDNADEFDGVDVEIDVEPGDQILINPFEMRAGDGRTVERAWAGFVVEQDGSFTELERGIAGVMPL